VKDAREDTTALVGGEVTALEEEDNAVDADDFNTEEDDAVDDDDARDGEKGAVIMSSVLLVEGTSRLGWKAGSEWAETTAG
jgi:hypothetical protein